MALIDGIYIHVKEEELSSEVQKSTHSVEVGIDVTDTIKPSPSALSLSGEVVSYTANAVTEGGGPQPITAWISLVKREKGQTFDEMDFNYLNNYLLAFEGGVQWVDTGAIQYFDKNGTPVNCAEPQYNVVAQVKFEVIMPYGSTVRIQNEPAQYCAFNIINKSTTGYEVRDYDADATTFSNSYNGEFGRVRTDFTNNDGEDIRAWISLVKKDGSAFDEMSIFRFKNELIVFEGGALGANLDEVQFLNPNGDLLDSFDENNVQYTYKDIASVKFEAIMPAGSTVRINDEYAQYCAFNIINKSNTGYEVRDYDADAIKYDNSYNLQFGRIRADFTNNDGKDMTAWISLVKKDGGVFEEMTLDRLMNDLLVFENGAELQLAQFFNVNGDSLDAFDENDTQYVYNDVAVVRFEGYFPDGGSVRINNSGANGDDYTEFCAFNIVNKSTTGYEIPDYDADASPLSPSYNGENFDQAKQAFMADTLYTSALSNSYNGETGRVRTVFTNYDDPATENPELDDERTAAWVLEQLQARLFSGALIRYEGRNLLENYQIRSLKTSHPNTITGGAEFTMDIDEFRGAANSYVAPIAATDEYINDSIPREGVQQIQTGDSQEVWYEVQVGDSVYNLVAAENAEYKNLTREPIDGVEMSAMEWVMAKNPDAFETYGNIDSLRAYTSILLGTR